MSLTHRLGISLLAGALLLGAAPRVARPHELPAPRRELPARHLAPSPSLGIIRPAPDFTLLDVNGRPVRLSELQGRVVLLSFIYAACTAACPLLTQRMALLQTRLRAARLFPSRVALLSDIAAVLARYANGFGADRAGWRFLREDPGRLKPVLLAYDEWVKPLPGGELDHPARVFLIDREGRREIYTLSFFDERQAFLDIQALLREPR